MTYQLLDVYICSNGIFNFSIADWFIVVDGVTDYFVAIQNVNKLCAYLLQGLGNEEVNCCQVLLRYK